MPRSRCRSCCALGLSGEVVLPSLTFVATAHALQWQEITPVFADIAPGRTTSTLSRLSESSRRERRASSVSIYGASRVISQELEEIARRHKLKLLFDAAHAFGSSCGGHMIGRFGDAEVFSFHATKFFNSFEGGAVTTNDDDLAQCVRLMRNFGFAGYDKVVSLGINGKMTEICAAMGLTSLESLDRFISTNRANYELYRRLLEDVSGLKLISYDSEDCCNYQYVVLEVDSDRWGPDTG